MAWESTWDLKGYWKRTEVCCISLSTSSIMTHQYLSVMHVNLPTCNYSTYNLAISKEEGPQGCAQHHYAC